jgi:predicted DCC family thiol-disulfide oxidoreductase YuxK
VSLVPDPDSGPVGLTARDAPPPADRARVGRPPATGVLIYDGDCAFCGRCVALLRRWDRAGRLRMVPFQDPAALAGLPAIPRSALEQAMHLVRTDGAVLAGAQALPPILGLLPFGAPFAWIFAFPGVPRIAAMVYRRIARNRHRFGCGSRSCTLGR